MANRSTFPVAIDEFIEHYELSSSDRPLLERFQILSLKQQLTPAEADELSTINGQIRNKLITAEDFNKLQDAIKNVQTFFRDETDGYIKTKQDEFNAYIDTKTTEINNHTNTKSTEITSTATSATNTIQSTKDSALISIEQKKENIIAYMDGTTAGAIRNDIGVMGDLATTNKTSLVNAINEVNSKSPDDASTTKKGIVQLSDSITSTSTTQAATANAVKKVNDKINNISLTASNTSITDTGGFFNSPNTEGALQEVGQTISVISGSILATAQKALNQ
ncbi:tail fiber protein [Bacillus infantis]|uniref:tail fiber protein n=1 Tax=Bacillus infantis TaxID=324767 RepID=UPI003CF0C4EF